MTASIRLCNACNRHTSKVAVTTKRLINQQSLFATLPRLRGPATAIPHISFSRSFHATTVAMEGQTRAETDAFGEVRVQADKYWGAQTERSLTNFRINQPQDRMPPAIIKAFGILKGAAATVNMRYGLGGW